MFGVRGDLPFSPYSTANPGWCAEATSNVITERSEELLQFKEYERRCGETKISRVTGRLSTGAIVVGLWLSLETAQGNMFLFMTDWPKHDYFPS